MNVDSIDRQIGARLRAMREARGVGQHRLAEMVGAAPEDIDLYESGERSTPVALIVRLARALGAPAVELIGEDSDAWREALILLARSGADGSVELVTAFSSIPDARVRRAFLDLIWRVVEAQEGLNSTG
jgi:transcriptional regulator with XRE-family HTH domain